MSQGLEHHQAGVIISRQMNPRLGCPCPPESPGFRNAAHGLQWATVAGASLGVP